MGELRSGTSNATTFFSKFTSATPHSLSFAYDMGKAWRLLCLQTGSTECEGVVVRLSRPSAMEREGRTAAGTLPQTSTRQALK